MWSPPQNFQLYLYEADKVASKSSSDYLPEFPERLENQNDNDPNILIILLSNRRYPLDFLTLSHERPAYYQLEYEAERTMNMCKLETLVSLQHLLLI